MLAFRTKNTAPQPAKMHDKPSRASMQPHQAPSALPRFLQAKLTLSQPGDAYEQEADAVADRIMRVPEPALQRACACGGTCPSCKGTPPNDEDRLVQTKRTRASDAETDQAPSTVHDALNSPGHALDQNTASFFGERFHRDMSDVRVHTDTQAVASARALSAAAYTVGRDIVFDTGRYSPNSIDGKRLLAHELTHVVQQGAMPATTATIQRAPSDFQIRGINPDAASDPSTIFFDIASSTITAAESAKIAALASPAARALTLNGFTSEEGGGEGTLAMVNARLDAVVAALVAAGHTGTRTRTPQVSAGVGRAAYRNVRAVEVLPTPIAGPPPSAVPSCAAGSSTPCGTSFSTAHPIAMAMLNSAVTALGPPVTAAATALLSTLFSGVAVGTVRTNVTNLRTHVTAMPAQHQCHNACDAGCGRPAYNTGSGVAAPPAGAMITLCPGYITGMSLNERAATLIHEGAHGTAGLVTDDIAYDSSRMIPFLTAAQSVINTDSYVLLIRLLHAPGSVSIGPASPDMMMGAMTAGEQVAGRRAIALLESWLLNADFDTDILYDAVHRSIPPAAAWASASGDAFNRETLHLIAAFFGLTDPGVAAPFTQPTAADKFKIASIHDRFLQMRRIVWSTPITMTKVPPGGDVWTAGSPTVSIGTPFFGMTTLNQVRRLLTLLTTVTPDISAPLVPKYVDAADAIRAHRGTGP